MSFEGLEPVADVSVGDWIGPRLRGFGGRVAQVVPDGFPAYARVLHPATDEQGDPVTWAEVCARTGRTAHALMQWNSIAGVVRHEMVEGRWPRRRTVSTTSSEWSGTDPEQGNAPPAVLAGILDVLGGFTAPGTDCYHALWEGWGWLHPGSWGFLRAYPESADDDPPDAPPEGPGLPPEVLDGPRLRLPGRDYVVFRGPLEAALRMGHQVTDDWFVPQSPSLLWPADRSWCLATEVDFDSTLVGGSVGVVDALLAAPSLEAWPVAPADDLTMGGDVVNGPRTAG